VKPFKRFPFFGCLEHTALKRGETELEAAPHTLASLNSNLTVGLFNFSNVKTIARSFYPKPRQFYQPAETFIQPVSY